MGELEMSSSNAWEERWKTEARSARALEAFKLKDQEISSLHKEITGLKRQLDIVENTAAQQASDRETRLEKKWNQAEAKISKLNTQLDANRRTNQKLTDEKLDFQTNCRAAQERAKHAETRLSEMIGQNTLLQDQLKDAKKPKSGPGPRECQKEELKQARADLVAALQKVAETENKLAGVKAQRETLSNQLREERELSKNVQFNQDHHQKTLERFQLDIAAAQDASKEKEKQVESQTALIAQLQALHADAQNLLKKQEGQHKSQMDGIKKSQKKLILFCQRLENKRDEDRKSFKSQEEKLNLLKEDLEEKQAEMAFAVERKQAAEHECLSLRLELQQMLDEAQMSDTKRDVIREQKMLQYRDQEAELNATIHQQRIELEEWSEKYSILESELKNQIKYSKSVLEKCEVLTDQEKSVKYRLKQKEEQLANWRKKSEHNELALRSQMKRAGQLESELKEISDRVSVAEKSRDKAILNSKSLRSEKHKLTKEINLHKEKLDDIELENIRSKFRKKGLSETELDTSVSDYVSDASVSQNHKAIVVEIKLLRKSLKKLDAELAHYRNENGELSDENQELRARISSTTKMVKETEQALEAKKKDLEKMKRNHNISQERVKQLTCKLDMTLEELRQANLNEAVQEKLKNAEIRLKNVMKDNLTLKQRVEDVTQKFTIESETDNATKTEVNRLKKDLERKRTLIEELQTRIKSKEKQVDDVTEKMDLKSDDLDSKSSQLQQSKRANDNLRRQINEMKLEKDSLYVELTTIRSRLSKIEASKAEVDLELKKTENSLQTEAEQYEAVIQSNQDRQKQALKLLQSKLEESKLSRNELSKTVRNILEILLLKLDKKQKEKRAELMKESDFEIIPECTDKVCDILNISNDEFNSIMNVGNHDTPSEGNSSCDWLGSIVEVIAAGPPFSETITNSFRLKLNDLIAYYTA